MKLGTLQLFAHVMEQGSFSKAAIAAFTTQSNISKQISSLEEEIGVRLFERNNQGVAPTPAAVCLSMGLKEQLPMMKRLLEQTRKAAEADQRQPHAGTHHKDNDKYQAEQVGNSI